MSTQVKRRREAATYLATYTGAAAELIVDTTNNRVQVHDGATAGGFPAAKLTDNAVAFTGGTINGIAIGGTTPAAGHFTTLSASGSINFGSTSPSYMTIQGPSDVNNILAQFNSTSTIAAGSGGGISLGGYYTGTTPTAFAYIFGLKNNATSGDFGSYLTFCTRLNGGLLAEQMRIDSSGNLIVATNKTVIDQSGTYYLGSFTVSTLPAAGHAGRMAFASNGRMYNGAGTLEGSGAGTGGLVVDNGTAWKIAGTNQTVQA